MGDQSEGKPRAAHSASPYQRILKSPIDFVADNNMREREVCTLIEELVSAQNPDMETCCSVLAFLTEELPLNLGDENEDLLPLMRQRCEEEDEIDVVIKRLQTDHGHALQQVHEIVALLDGCKPKAGGFDEETRSRLTGFVGHARRYTIVENAIILPLARARLTDSDLDALRENMLARRNLGGPNAQ